MLGLLLCLAPGIYLWVAWTVAAPVLLLEDVRGWKAMKRSRQLVKGRFWPTFAVVLLVAILTGIVQAMFVGILAGVVSVSGNEVALAIADAIGQTASGVLTTPLSAAVLTVLYFDLRVRKEGFDLELLVAPHGRRPGHGGQPGVPAAGGAGAPAARRPRTGRRTGRHRRTGARRMRDRRWAVAVAVAGRHRGGVGPVGPASAQSVTGTQLQDLAARAAGDPRALAQLRAVREVDGRPVDMGRALAGAEGPGAGVTAPGPLRRRRRRGRRSAGDQARQEAQDVLDGRRFKPARVPRPFAGILRTLGRWLEPVGEPLGRVWGRMVDTVAGRLVLVGLVFVAAALISLRLVGRRSPGTSTGLARSASTATASTPTSSSARPSPPSGPATWTMPCGCGSSPASCAWTGPA